VSESGPPADKKYIDDLSKYFKANISFKSLQRVKTKFENVFFLPGELSLIEMQKKWRDFLVVTHHGTIATEAAFLGLDVYCSSTSPYSINDCFIKFYNDSKTFRDLLSKRKLVTEKDSDYYECLGRYMFLQHFIVNIKGICPYFNDSDNKYNNIEHDYHKIATKISNLSIDELNNVSRKIKNEMINEMSLIS